MSRKKWSELALWWAINFQLVSGVSRRSDKIERVSKWTFSLCCKAQISAILWHWTTTGDMSTIWAVIATASYAKRNFSAQDNFNHAVFGVLQKEFNLAALQCAMRTKIKLARGCRISARWDYRTLLETTRTPSHYHPLPQKVWIWQEDNCCRGNHDSIAWHWKCICC